MRSCTSSHAPSADVRGSPCWVRPCFTSRWPALAVRATKKGGDKKGGDKKGQKKSALADLLEKKEAAKYGSTVSPTLPSLYDTPDARMLAFQMCDSYWRLTKKFLLEGVEFDRLPTALYRAPFALLAHNRFQEGVTDPIYTYGNRAALELFETSVEELLLTPSRHSAVDDPSTQKDRNGLLDQAAKTGIVTGFEAWRVSKKGRRFKILDGTLFNIKDRAGNKVGQAAVFSSYQLEDGKVVVITATEELEESPPAIPGPEDIEAAEAAVAEQAAVVRSLKEGQGLTNQDIPVQLAVIELKRRKEAVATLQRRLEEALAASRAAFDDEVE